MEILLRLVVVCIALWNAAAHAETYPDRPVTIIVPFGAGAASDTLARVVGQHLSIALKQNVIVENRPGANGAIAAAYVARSAPDGTTLFLATNSPLSAAPFLTRNVSYDPAKDFAPISRVGSFTLVLVVNSSVPVRSIAELAAYARANPGKLTFASGNTSGIVAGETLNHWAGIDILHVPYKSVPPALNDVLGGRISMMVTDLTTGLPHINSNVLHPLGITRKDRSRLLPEVPTFDESGVTGFDMDSWAGLVAPANTPREIIALLNAETRKIIDDPAVKGRLGTIGFEAFSSSPEELGEFIKDQLGKWAKMIKEAGIEPE